MRHTLRAAQRAASSVRRAAAAPIKAPNTPTTTRAAPLPYAPPQRTARQINPAAPAAGAPPARPTIQTQSAAARPTSPTTPAPPPLVKPGSPGYNIAAGKYTRAMIAMPILLLTSYVLYGRFAGGPEEKQLPGAEGQPKLVVLDK